MKKRIASAVLVCLVALPAQGHEAEPLPQVPSWTVTHWRQEWAQRAFHSLTPELLGEWRWMQTHYWPVERRSSLQTQKATPRPSNLPPTNPTAYPSGVEQWRNLVAWFWPVEHVDRMLRIMACESDGNPYADNPRSSALGLFQIMGSWQKVWPGDYTDPWTNAAVAYQIWLTQGYAAWVCKA